jgi:NAD(P)-dependent dehydrogenase (short-subunit alcohol dehydrogenase family)
MGTEQKVAVISGASGGIGSALVKAYRARAYRVVAMALSERLERRSNSRSRDRVGPRRRATTDALSDSSARLRTDVSGRPSRMRMQLR